MSAGFIEGVSTKQETEEDGGNGLTGETEERRQDFSFDPIHQKKRLSVSPFLLFIRFLRALRYLRAAVDEEDGSTVYVMKPIIISSQV